MSKKKKLPFWLAVVLAMVLIVLLIIVGMIPDRSEQIPTQKVPVKTTYKKAAPQVEPQPSVVKPHQPAEPVPEIIPASPEPITEPVLEIIPVSPESMAEPVPEVAPPAPVIIGSGTGISLVMDDVGYDMHALKRILQLSVPVAISVLPGAPFAHQSATLAHQQGQIVMLHLPMEPLVPKYQKSMTDTFLRADMSESELRQTFLKDLAAVPYVEGINNHMGSRLTQLEQPMNWVMRICREQGLFFVDSKTSSGSVAAREAANMGLAWASRRYFLDHQLDEQAMLRAWSNARTCAAKGYRCIVIAHPHKETISFLEKHLTKDDMAHMLPLKDLLRSTPAKLKKVQEGKPMEKLL